MALALVGACGLAGAASSTAFSGKISARLTKTSFKPAQVGSVRLIYKFSATSKRFSYLLSFKKGAKWQKVKSVKKKGSFKGSKSMTVKKVFAGKPVKVGKYRLKLSADGGSKTLSFKVIKAKTPVPPPTGNPPANTALPTISGTAKQGQKLTASRGSWSHSPTSYDYRWDRCVASGAICADIGGATSSSYTLVAGDVGWTIRVIVTASNSYGSASATSEKTGLVSGLPPANTVLPAISGTTTQGQTLSASNGSWSNSPTSYTRQWRRCNSSGAGCSDISGAGSSSYTLAAADVGSTIRVVVTAANSDGSASATSSQTPLVAALRSNPPSGPVKLIFIHHSTGTAWLADGNGELGIALKNNGYFVSDTNYGWGPDGIGDRTDTGHWWTWFRGPSSSTYMNALYNEFGQNASYSRLASDPDPARENQIVMFKSCFPNSNISGNPGDPATTGSNPLRDQYAGSAMTVANVKGIYNDLLTYFAAHQDKLFVLIVPPPLADAATDAARAANARAVANWLVSDWLASYGHNNVAVFDFYNLLTSNGGGPDVNDLGAANGNHHRWWDGSVQHSQTVSSNFLAYPTGDSHPSRAGNLKATGEFIDLLNYYYHRWAAASG